MDKLEQITRVVASAMHAAAGYPEGVVTVKPGTAEAVARAVIKAMREPTEGRATEDIAPWLQDFKNSSDDDKVHYAKALMDRFVEDQNMIKLLRVALLSSACPAPVGRDGGTVQSCFDAGHCGCDNSEALAAVARSGWSD